MSFSAGSSDSIDEKEDDRMSVDSDSSYEVLEQSDCKARLYGLLIHVGLAIIIIGGCSGALIWSIVRGESGSDNGGTLHIRDSSKNFTVYVDEYTEKDGTYTITYRVPNNKNGSHAVPMVYPSFWYQDDKHKRLVHGRDVFQTVYAFPTHSYWVHKNASGHILGCRYNDKVTYQVYINRIGLANLVRQHSAFERTANHEKVFIYDGDPHDVIIEGTPQNAFLVTAYADAGTGALLGWDTYFTAAADSGGVYEMSYWYDKMTPQTPVGTKFDPPGECSPSYGQEL